MKHIKKALLESLYDQTEPKVGFMRFNWEAIDDSQIDKIFEQIRSQLEQISVDISKLNNLKDSRKIMIITTEDRSEDIQNIFDYFQMPLDNMIFDTDQCDGQPDNYLKVNTTIIRN